MRSWMTPSSIMWLAGHVLLVFAGMLCMTTEGERAFGEALGESLGSGLLATGIAGLVLYLYVRATESVQKRLDIITEAGLINVFRHRSMRIKGEYDSRLQTASRIDLIGLGLSSFREDYKAQFAEWSQKARIRIILLDPDFPSADHSLADLRDLEEGGKRGEIRADVEAFIAEVSGNRKIDTTRLEIRTASIIPAINLLRIDDEIFWGPYLMAERSRNTPTLLVRRGGFLFESLENHFEATWSAADRARG